MKLWAWLALTLGPLAGAGVAEEVKVWQGELKLPSYLEGAPNVNPPFDAFATTRFNYPYTLREQITAERVEQRYRALFLENEYLRCAVLPDIGGHLYNCTDKRNGAEMFYRNPSIKKAQVGYRGAWAAFGIEFNFPVSHNWVSMSPVDFATVRHGDGSASLWVGNRDRVYGMQWRVELRLRPGSTVLEQHVRLENPSRLRHRFYWWNNAAAEVWDDTRIVYPQRLSASHGFAAVDTWPVNHAGMDLSVVKNHTAGPVSQFAHRSREEFMGVYHPRTDAGVVHVAAFEELPGKKIWAWGVDADGLDWRKALSDNESAYVEVQAGLFRNQETYAFLQPQETLEFHEYWVPVRGIGGFVRANLEAVVNIERGAVDRLGLNVTHALAGARLSVSGGGATLLEETVSLSPADVLRRNLPAAKAYTVTLRAADGRLLLQHEEGGCDCDGPEVEKPGVRSGRAVVAPGERTEGDFVETGKDQELNGRLLDAWRTYQQGLKRYAGAFELRRAAGRLAVQLMRFEEAEALLSAAQQEMSNDDEIHYYRGLALEALGRPAEAREQLQRALLFRAMRPAAALELARAAARRGDWQESLGKARVTIQESAQSTTAGWLEVVALKRLGRREEAQRRLSHWLALDPTSTLLRLEEEAPGAALWKHLGAEPERVLDVVSEYLPAGLTAEALRLLDREYAEVEPIEAEPGAVRPQAYALATYYRAYCRQLLGQAAKVDWALAGRQSTRYVFPSRAGTFAVLRAALKENPDDATAHFLLGSLYMAGGMTEQAVASWERARRLNPALPVLHRNLGVTLLEVNDDAAGAAGVLREGLKVDAGNTELYAALSRALSLLERPAAERVAVFAAWPEPAKMPAALVYGEALALAEAGRFDEAEQRFANRFFPREEGGTNVRQVYLEVRLQRALSAARGGRSAEALQIVAELGRPVASLQFTRDGMQPLLAEARVQFLLAEIEERCGQTEAAGRRRRELVEHDGRRAGSAGVYACRAARLTGDPAAAGMAERLRIEAPGDTAGWSGSALYAAGLQLAESGRTAEARTLLRLALKAADRNLSQYLSREALAGLAR